MTVIDDDVKVWVAARTVALQKLEFSAQDLLDAIQKQFKQDAKKMERFVTQHCVANTPGASGKHYNYLFKLGPNKYRLFKTGDPIEYTHAGAPTSPEVSRVPAEYRPLFAAGKFEGIKPADAPKPEPKTEKPRAEAASRSQASAHAVLEKPAARPAVATKGLMVDLAELDANAPAAIARRTIFDLLFLEFGRLGSKLETKQGDTRADSFAIQHDKASGTVKTNQNFTIVLPSGGLIAHQADIMVELENPSRTLFIDIVEAATRTDEMKAHGFDAIHNRKDKKQRYSILVYLRTPAGMLQEQAEGMAYGYDFFFGADANDAKNSNKFYALKSQVVAWLEGKIKPHAAAG